MIAARPSALAAAGLLLVPAAANADAVWPALLLEPRLLTWWSIATGLIVEGLLVRWLFSLPLGRAVLACCAANAASTVLGVVLIPIAGVVWEFPAQLYMRSLGWGTFNPLTWAATFLLACAINTVIEGWVYRRGFQFAFGHRERAWVFVANAVSVGIALASLFVDPPRL